MRAPLFWQDSSFPSSLLLPFSYLYQTIARLHYGRVAAVRVGVPVICVGNLVAGGAGKTPVVLALAELLQKKGKNVFLLTRGYGGSLPGPVRIDPAHHTAEEVGDEPLLLAACAPTIMAKNRLAGARAAVEAGAQIIVMDDGFQNPMLHKDFSFVVVDGRYGLGNGRLLPAGPLRETLADGKVRASAFILIGEDAQGLAPSLSAQHPVLKAHMELDASVASLKGQRVVAFAGLARPQKFFHTLQTFGCEVKNAVGFPDHYRFREADITDLKRQATHRQALLVTTQKDYVRIPPAWREGIVNAPAHLAFEDTSLLTSLLTGYL